MHYPSFSFASSYSVPFLILHQSWTICPSRFFVFVQPISQLRHFQGFQPPPRARVIRSLTISYPDTLLLQIWGTREMKVILDAPLILWASGFLCLPNTRLQRVIESQLRTVEMSCTLQPILSFSVCMACILTF